jgi:hypothetical protein
MSRLCAIKHPSEIYVDHYQIKHFEIRVDHLPKKNVSKHVLYGIRLSRTTLAQTLDRSQKAFLLQTKIQGALLLPLRVGLQLETARRAVKKVYSVYMQSYWL